MNDLLRIAGADLAGAKYFASNEKDDVYLNQAGYHCAQAAEKMVKSYIGFMGLVPPKVHKVYELINYIKNRGLFDPMFTLLDMIALELDAWTSQTRYVVNPLAAKDRITYAINILDDLLVQLQTPKTEPTETLKDEIKKNPPIEYGGGDR